MKLPEHERLRLEKEDLEEEIRKEKERAKTKYSQVGKKPLKQNKDVKEIKDKEKSN